MLPPGYWAARWTNLCDFRARGLREQLAWSLALSFGAGTLPLVAITWLLGVTATGYLLAVIAVVTAILWVREHPAIDLTRREAFLYAAAILAWTALAIVSLIDIASGARLFLSVTSYDHSVRTAFVDAVMRNGVVPKNPLYWPGRAATMRYYYFWYVDCGLIARLAHISARQALLASCIWPPIGIAAMLALCGRYMLDWRGRTLRRFSAISLALMSITGLDVLMMLLGRSAGGSPPGDLEWWSVDQVTSWVDTFLWVPHHAAAAVCCALTALLLYLATQTEQPAARRKLAILAGLSYASSFGLSSYVAMCAIMAIAVWLLWRLFHTDRLRALSATTLAAVVAGITLAPYVYQLLHREPGDPPRPFPLAFAVRQIFKPTMLSNIHWLHALQLHHPFAETQIAAGILLIPGYVIELGFFALILLAAQRAKQKSLAVSTMLCWIWAGLLSASLLRSQVISTNDYSVRATLFAQFFLLLLVIPVWQRASRTLRACLLATAFIGVAGSIYQVAMLRLYLPYHQAHNDADTRDLAERNYALRDAYSAFEHAAPTTARIQYDVHAGGYFGYAQMLNENHQVINADIGCNTSFGGAKSACPAIQQAVESLFPTNPAPVSATTAITLCKRLGAQYLVATRWDAIWQNAQSYVWTLPATVTRPSVRILNCNATPE